MSAEHLWLEGRVARVCAVAGQKAVTEDYTTHADVYVPDVQLAIEVQRWSTDYQLRTDSRRRQGANVLWLLPEDGGAPNARSSQKALFSLPAARLRVHHRNSRQLLLQPWVYPEQRFDARLTVYGTVGKLNRETLKLENRMHDLAAFLDEIFTGRRVWCPPGTQGLPSLWSGCWVLTTDLTAVQALAGPRGGLPEKPSTGPSFRTPRKPLPSRLAPDELEDPVQPPFAEEVTDPRPSATSPDKVDEPALARPSGEVADPPEPVESHPLPPATGAPIELSQAPGTSVGSGERKSIWRRLWQWLIGRE
jgi:hypothetical protein